MRPIHPLLLTFGLCALAACARNAPVEIANNDSAALVAAIHQANARPGEQTIRLARNGLYILGEEAQPGLLLPSVRGHVSIEGNHAEIRGYSRRPAAILQVEDGAGARVENLVIAEGTDGAVRNYGRLHLQNVAIVDSSVDAMPAILINHGHLEAVDVEIAYNLILATHRDGGTVLNYGEIELATTRIHDNRAVGRNASVAVAGGILNFGAVDGQDVQIMDNELPGEASSLLSFGGILNLGNGRVLGDVPSEGIRDGRHPVALAAAVR